MRSFFFTLAAMLAANTSLVNASKANSQNQVESLSGPEKAPLEEIQLAQVKAQEEANLLAQKEALEIRQQNEAIQLAQIQARAEESQMKMANLEHFGTFLSQIGIDEEELMAQLNSEMSEDQIQYLATNPDIYRGLAQIASSHQAREKAAGQIFAQIHEREDPEDFESIASHLAQLETHEIVAISKKMRNNDEMSFAQVANEI